VVPRRSSRLLKRAIALPLLFVACAALGLGCGNGGGGAATGKVQTFAQPNHSPQGRVPADDKEATAEQTKALATSAGRARARKQISIVVNRFIAASRRRDSRTMCSLFSPIKLRRTGGAISCRRFYTRTLAKTQISSSSFGAAKIIFVKGGSLAEVTFHGIRLFEMQPLNGDWVIERSPGY
jgi:hypothetical protein